ncbi:hypothetical protein RFI_35615 [Reticulomyxa filosa]|uniref:Uncharacterized protein n=1 Tax=Reticulomyxa filosa TaxID=46433 RepID=X6LJN9_RETFI|nr:hypothetical protein RFI_35615 [Reticulomyxa filosa]|eukprot:ETO01824.1 hypothetical protein RFI_35615 [Reticulomyxa filosa]
MGRVIIEIEACIRKTSKVTVILVGHIPRCVNEVLECGWKCLCYLYCHWCCSESPAIMAIVIATAAVSISMVAVDKSNTGNIIVELLLMMEIMEAHYNTRICHFSNKIYVFIIEQIFISDDVRRMWIIVLRFE